jgi:hypothetical protein
MLKFALQENRVQNKPIQAAVPTTARDCDPDRDLSYPHDNETLPEVKDSCECVKSHLDSGNVSMESCFGHK